MSTLPFEILTHTFNYLQKKDRLQCQLTSKEWYEASTNSIYSTIQIRSSEESRLFGRTISNSLHLGARLKVISTSQIFTTKKRNEPWDEHGLLNKLIVHCPNLIEIRSQTPDNAFWLRISHAASRGHLSRLQVLPVNNSWNLEHYIHTALHFKASLRHLIIFDESCILGTDLNSLEIYQELLDQIGEFKELQKLELFYQSNRQLSCFDSVIDNCPNLIGVYLTLFPLESQRMIVEHQGLLTPSPRPNIRHLICSWDIISTKKQIQYMAQKFPNLKTLSIECVYHSKQITPRSYSHHALTDFLRYATSLPWTDIHMPVTYQDLSNVMTELIMMKDIYRDIIVSFAFSIPNVNGALLTIEAKALHIEFLFPEHGIDFPWTNFFLETGNKIRSIKIQEPRHFSFFRTIDGISPIQSGVGIGIGQIFKVLHACPMLEGFTMALSAYYYMPLFDNQAPELPNLKKLTVSDVTYNCTTLVDFLRFASPRLPNIKQLCLFFIGDRWDFGGYVTVDMKEAQLDLILLGTGEDFIRCLIDSNLVTYFKLKTANDPQIFYIGDKNGLLPILETQFQHAKDEHLLCVDITCQSLKEFRITSKASPTPTFTWFF